MYRKLVFYLHLSHARVVLKHLNHLPTTEEEDRKVQEFLTKLRGDIAEQVLNNSNILKGGEQ